MRSEKPDLSSINHIYCNVLRTVSSYSGSVQGSLYSRKERSNRAVHVCVLREFLYRKNSCRLQGGNSTSENALAGCKREIPPRIMPLQVARGKFHHGKCSCRLQEENRSTGNALAGCKRKIAQPKMLLQVAREKSLNRKCPCRLQEENRSTENALAGCKRRIAQPKMQQYSCYPKRFAVPSPLGEFRLREFAESLEYSDTKANVYALHGPNTQKEGAPLMVTHPPFVLCNSRKLRVVFLSQQSN